jgi:hypothetical protein
MSKQERIPDKGGKGYWTKNKFNQPMYVSYSKSRLDRELSLTEMMGGV